MVTYEELFKRVVMDENDYAAAMAIGDAVAKDLDASYAEYQQAIEAWELASDKHNAENSACYDYEYDIAYLEMQKKYIAYLEKDMLNSAFHGYYKKA